MYEIECNGPRPTIPNMKTPSAIYGWLKNNSSEWEGTIVILRDGRSVAKVVKTEKKNVIITFLD